MTPRRDVRRHDGAGLVVTGKGGTVRGDRRRLMTQDQVRPSTCSSSPCGTRRSRARSSARCNPRADIPRCLGLYREGTLKLDELITKRYTLDQINDGYEAMRDGENIRGVVVYD